MLHPAGDAEAVSVITGALVSALKPPIMWNVLRNDFPLNVFDKSMNCAYTCRTVYTTSTHHSDTQWPSSTAINTKFFLKNEVERSFRQKFEHAISGDISTYDGEFISTWMHEHVQTYTTAFSPAYIGHIGPTYLCRDR